MQERNCQKCETELERPHDQYANYVMSDDFVEAEAREINYAMVHTEDTKKKLNKMDRLLPDRDRQAINAEMAHPDAPVHIEVDAGTKTVESDGGTTETADLREMEFSVPVEEFDHVEIDDPNVIQRDGDVALTYSKVEERDVQKTGLVCSGCTDADDKIIWGVDESEDEQ